MNRNITAILTILLFCAGASFASNLANPAAQTGDARLSIGASYGIDGVTITDMKIPMMMNRVVLRLSYTPVRYLSFGVDGGTITAEVDRYKTGYVFDDVIHQTKIAYAPVFDGGFGWIAGGHAKASTPYLFDYVSIFALGSGAFFRSENDYGAYYGGKEGIGVIGAQVRIPGFGFISVGPRVHLIMGENRSHDGIKGTYSNRNNVRGWVAVDYFPDMQGLTGETKPYATLEFSMSPKIKGSDRVPVQEFGVSISIGAITDRLYGEDKDAEEF